MIGIVLKTNNEVEIVDIVADSTGDEMRAMQGFVGGYIEHVRPRGLPHPYCMIVNEEGLLDGLPRNRAASALYGGITPIVGDVLILKDAVNEFEEGIIAGMEMYEAQQIIEALCFSCPFLTKEQ